MLLLPIGLFASAPVVAAAGLLVDTLAATTLGAYGMRKLRSAYAGSCVRVRRSTDNTELDIGFVSGNLDTAAIATFCGSGDGLVTTWYDQSGNGYNMGQVTAANQPGIYFAGTQYQLINAKAQHGIRIFTPYNYMQGGFSFGASGAAYAISAVAERSANCPDYGRLLGFVATGDAFDYSTPNSNIFFRFATAGSYLIAGQGSIAQMPNTTSPFQAVMTCSAGVEQLTLDGAASPTATATGALASSGTLIMGIADATNDTSNSMWDGAAAEFIITAGTLSTTDQAKIRASQQTYYGTP